MRVIYQENERISLAEADEISRKGSTLTVLLRSGKTLNVPFPDETVLEEFFNDIVLPAGDTPIRLQFTQFDPRLGEMLSEWDAMFDD